ncbi:phage baseplate assembly protein V [Salmonella enterica]|nr:phage baseplate assembly protein V [Salmonella enterica]
MNIENEIADLRRRIDNLIRTGVVTEVSLKQGTCRVRSGQLETRHLPVVTLRAGDARVWWPPSPGEQVTLLCTGGDPSTAVVLPGLFCDAFPPPDAREKTLHIRFPDGATLEYDAVQGALKADGMKTATVNASESISATTRQATVQAEHITLDAQTVTCTGLLETTSLDVGGSRGGKTTLKGPVNLTGSLTQSGGSLTSNGITLDSHVHGGVQTGGGTTGGPR